MRSTIEEDTAKKNKKELLDSILRRGGVGSFDDEKAGRIAKAILESEIGDEIKDIFKKFSIEKTAVGTPNP